MHLHWIFFSSAEEEEEESQFIIHSRALPSGAIACSESSDAVANMIFRLVEEELLVAQGKSREPLDWI